MTEKQQENTISALIAVAVVLLLLLFIASFSSCSFSRKATEKKQNDSQVVRVDSTTVNKSESKQTNENSWFKEWATMLPRGKDSIVYKETQTNLQPIYYYREGGTTKQENWQFNVDSFTHALLDSLNKDKSTTVTDTKAETFGFWHLIGLGVVCLAVGWGFSKIKISLK
ncbi:MAG: hypothetical protein EKK63_09055 [Acinetobacter sp.]|uniref:hypothetical protein n=1 Tax=Acinetobacter sp. TaxID=472 RepID=UPI000FB43FFB|nr:hypothetical protein [Acinetobacter sp.]RUP39776.1 MAG: hypothetical protein EKK63_09055 [Acinetobacter sp.]